MLAPCKDCTERYVGCHSKCEKYIAFDKYRKSFLEKVAKVKKLESDIICSSRYQKQRKRGK